MIHILHTVLVYFNEMYRAVVDAATVDRSTPAPATLRPLSIPYHPDFDYLNEEARVSQTIYPYQKGRVYLFGSWWSARCLEAITLEVGTMVRVVGIANITLLVKPIELEQQGDRPYLHRRLLPQNFDL